MVPIMSLWIPILLSAVIVFVASSIIHMVLPLHRKDLRRLPKEDEVMQALRGFNIPPGDYAIPCAGSPETMSSPEFVAKMKHGPVAFMTFVFQSSAKAVVAWILSDAVAVASVPFSLPSDELLVTT